MDIRVEAPQVEGHPPVRRAAQSTRVVKRRHLWSWVGGVAAILLVGAFLNLLFTNENMRWEVVVSYLFDREILSGLLTTIKLTFLAMAIGLALGIVLALMRLSKNPLLKGISWMWVWFFRGVPPLVQMVFWFNLATLIPFITIGLPFGQTSHTWDVNTLISSFSAAILGLALTESAYAAEMIRAGIMAVPKGQTEAGQSLGLTRAQMTRRIVLPQALRIVIPPIGNDLISMLKFTSLVSVLATPDLLYSAQMIYSRNYQTIPLLLVATAWYLVLTTFFTVIQQLVEGHITADSATRQKRLQFLPNFRQG